MVVVQAVEGMGSGEDGDPELLLSLVVMTMSWEKTGLIDIFPHVENGG